jgi:hypothetical protein|tara:strand:- start:4289 stop:4513 length:225 start_codon:yes stop_codon:yes gene_type:complete
MTEKDQEEVSVALNAINDCLKALHERLEAVEKYVQELPTPDKTYYKPEGQDEYLNIKGNYDQIYQRLKKLEDGM